MYVCMCTRVLYVCVCVCVTNHMIAASGCDPCACVCERERVGVSA